MALSPGTQIGPYEVGDEIGAGGMGVVYRATDTNLKREVAIKALPESLAQDAERLARFQREAEVLASLNHPNIAQIYGLEKADGTAALIMELVEGPTLADRIAKGPLPPGEAIGIAMQIADALEAAHGQSIVHRDLKPANVKLRPDGTVKVLDFGIAKALEPDVLRTEPPSPMLTTPATQVGVILGTAAYMSPEQAKGQPVDQRSDIWAVGCVLYEMLTGQLAFGAEDIPTTLARVIDRDTNMDSLPAAISPAVRRTIQLCLQKDAKKRVADIRDVRLALEGVFETVSPRLAAAEIARPVWRRPLPVAAAAVLVTGLVVGFAGEVLRREAPLEAPLVNVKRTHILLGATEALGNTGLRAHVALAPDGQRLAYAAQVDGRRQLYIRELDQLEARPMPRSDGAFYPFFSPDGEWVGFFTDDPDQKLKKVSIRGGTPQTLAEATFSGGGSWMTDDVIVYGTGDPSAGRSLFRVPANGGMPEDLLEPEPDTGHGRPEVLPGGNAMLFQIRPGTGGSGAAGDGRIAVHSLATGEVRPLIDAAHTPRYAPTGHILFLRAGDLWAVPFDAERLEITGREVPVVEGVAQDGIRGGASYAISNDGMLVYEPGFESGNPGGQSRSLVWVDRQGREEALAVESRNYWNPRLSPDDQRLAVSVDDGLNEDLWIIDLTRGSSSRATFNPGDDFAPLWMPDGEQLAFWSVEASEDGSGIFRQAANGTGQPERLTASASVNAPEAFSPDGSLLVFRETGTGANDLYVVSSDGEGDSQPLVHGAFFEGAAAISPSGRWIAYHSNESGRGEIYVRPFPNADEGKWQVSIDGGLFPRWGLDGTELFFRNDNAVLKVNVEGEDAFSVGTPEVLFRGTYWINNIVSSTYDISRDGQRFLMMKVAAPDSQEQASDETVLVAVENWFEELNRLAPPTE